MALKPYILIAHRMCVEDKNFWHKLEFACKCVFMELAREDDTFKCDSMEGIIFFTTNNALCENDVSFTIHICGVDESKDMILLNRLAAALVLLLCEYRVIIFSGTKEEYIVDNIAWVSALSRPEHIFGVHSQNDLELFARR